MPITFDIVSFYRGWRRLEERRSRFHGLWVVIDDLAATSIAPSEFKGLGEVRERLAELIKAVEQTDELEGVLKELTLERLRQSRNYIEQPSGTRASAADVRSRGLRWEIVTDAELAGLRADYLGLHRELVDAGIATVDELDEFQKESRGSLAVARSIQAIGLRGAEALRRLWPWLATVSCDVETETSEGAWRNIVTTSEQGSLKLILNEGPNATFSPALQDFLGLHEVAGHMVHFSYLKTRSELQTKAPHLLLMAIHGQDAYYVEGVAQLLSEIACDAVFGRLSVQNLELRRVEYMLALRNQCIMRIIDGELTVEEAAAIHHAALGGDRAVLKGQYAAYTSDPFFCCQVLVFYPSLKALKPALRLGRDELSAFAEELLSLSGGPEAIDALVARYVR